MLRQNTNQMISTIRPGFQSILNGQMRYVQGEFNFTTFPFHIVYMVRFALTYWVLVVFVLWIKLFGTIESRRIHLWILIYGMQTDYSFEQCYTCGRKVYPQAKRQAKSIIVFMQLVTLCFSLCITKYKNNFCFFSIIFLPPYFMMLFINWMGARGYFPG